MTRYPSLLRNLVPLAWTLLIRLVDAVRFLCLCLHPSDALAAENLFLRTQLALDEKRDVTPPRATQATRIALTWLARWSDLMSTALKSRQHDHRCADHTR
jgi:hypothetical protein